MVPLLSYEVETTPEYPIRIISRKMPLCTCGKSRLTSRDCVIRCFLADRDVEFRIRIPRGQCPVCHATHRMLPLFLCPHKQYLSLSIQEALDKGYISEKNSGPSESTVNRWRKWAGEDYANVKDDPRYACFSKKFRTRAAQSHDAFFSKLG